MFNPLQIKNCSKSASVIKEVIMKNTDAFLSCKESHYVLSLKLTQSTFFAVCKDGWDTKDDTGNSMKNVLYIPHCHLGKLRQVFE